MNAGSTQPSCALNNQDLGASAAVNMEQGKINIVKQTNLFFARARLDEHSLETAFQEYYARIYHVIFRLVGDRDEADDLTAETFWKLWENPPSSRENLAGWLYRVATRLGYNALRAARRRMQYESEAGQNILQWIGGDSPEAETEKRYERQKVHAVLRQMQLREVQILILRHSGLSYKEIAAAVSVAPASVGNLIARAEEKFERIYRKGDPDAS